MSVADILARFGLRTGDKLVEFDQATADRLTTLNGLICRHEEFWLKRLVDLKPVEIPYAIFFKAGFSDQRYEFNTWNWIVSPDVYSSLQQGKSEWCRQNDLDPICPDYFPAFRCPDCPRIEVGLGAKHLETCQNDLKKLKALDH